MPSPSKKREDKKTESPSANKVQFASEMGTNQQKCSASECGLFFTGAYLHKILIRNSNREPMDKI